MRRVILAFLALFSFAPATFASFNVRFNSTGYGLAGSLSWTSADGNSGSGNFFIGQLSFQHHYVNSGNIGTQFNSFCIDLRGRLNSGLVYSVEERNLSTYVPSANVDRLAFLYDKYGDDSSVLPGVGVDSNQWFAALQLAVWRLTLADPGSSLNSSLLTGSTLSYYNGFLNETLNSSYGSGVKWLDRGPNPASGNAVGQHLLYNPPQLQQPPTVPAPGGLVLAAAGGLFFSATGLSRRFRRAV